MAMNNRMDKMPHGHCWSTIGVWSRADERCKELGKYIHCRNCPVFANAGRSVFEKVAPSGYLAEWRKEIASAAVAKELRTNSILVFRISREWFALPVAILCEIANEKPIHHIPQNKKRTISGIVNINGEIKICYSLLDILSIKRVDEAYESDTQTISRRLIVIELDGREYVFPASEVQGLSWFSDDDLMPVPATIKADNAGLLLGVVSIDLKQVAVFDTDSLKARLEREVL